MIITKLDKVGTKQVRLFFDEEKYCLLYYNEIRRLGFHEQDEIGQEEFEELNKLLLHRAKLKAMSLLKYQDRTKKELKERLMRAEFPEFITEGAVAYVESFGYINDDAYIRNFIDSRKDKKSRREIYALLRQKGVDMNRAEEIMEEMYEEHSDQEAIRELLRKKHWDFACTDPKEKQKIYGYLVRKGFRYEDIRQVIQINEIGVKKLLVE